MRWTIGWGVVAAMVLAACGEPVPRVAVPPPSDPSAYQPQLQPKPLPPEAFGMPANPVPAPAQPGAGPGSLLPAHPALPSEGGYVQAYQNHRRPRMMVFVNRTIHGDVLGKDKFEAVVRADSAAADKYEAIGASRTDFEMIEASILDYLSAGGKVQMQDSDAARQKLGREMALRIENNDPAAVKLLNTELQTDVLVRVDAVPTQHSQFGQAVRIIAKAISVADARNLGTEFVDMPLPISKDNVNTFTGYLSEKLMQKMARVWAGDWDPIEMRIYKAATIDDSLKIRKFVQGIRGVQTVNSGGATGSSVTSYAVLRVQYPGAPEDLYADLKEALGRSAGLKAVDLQNNTITLEVTGEMNLVTTTQTTETKTTTEVKTTETKTVEPIRPAGNP